MRCRGRRHGGPDDATCPGDLAVVLTVDPGGAIIGEQRYHRLDDLRRCAADGALPSGWWDEMVVPAPVRVAETGTLEIDGAAIEVFNGTPGLEGLIRWGFGRFAGAALGAPEVSRVTFYDTQVDRCEGVSGVILADAVTLCFDAEVACLDDSCRDWQDVPKRTVLHELAHAWMARNLTTATIGEFLRATGKPTWAGTTDRWEDRGVELAAETIAWGLMDGPTRINLKLGAPTCGQLAGYFEILTGQPLDPRTVCAG